MSKYFAKYISQKGEIKEGDKVRYKWPNKDFTLETVLEVAKNGDVRTDSKKFPYLLKDSTQLFKLFLCSREIQMGDKCFVEGGSGEEYVATRDNIQGYYKVIGEISPDALGYVKEGDEFDEYQIKITEPWNYKEGDWEDDYRLAKDRITGNEEKVRPYSPSFGISRWEILEIFWTDRVIKIKGPCGHFH